MMGSNNFGVPVPRQIADMSMHMLAPKREVIVDMVMVQLISAILVFRNVNVYGRGISFLYTLDLYISENNTVYLSNPD